MADDAHYPAGYRQIRWRDVARNRLVWVDVWHPASAGAAEQPQNYGLGMGSAAVDVGFAAGGGPWPLIVISHGAGGSSRNYSWLAEFLARDGFVVLGVNHYGESLIYGPETIDPAVFPQLWLRPPDCSFALDCILATSDFAERIDRSRIGALGHSSGGATVIALGGAVLDAPALGAYCRSADGAADRGCDYSRAAMSVPEVPPEAGASYRDARIRAIVALDPAAGPGYGEASLAGVALPALVVGSRDNDFLPFAHHAGRYAGFLPHAALITLKNGEGHFVYLDICNTDFAANGVPICVDRDGVDRRAVHALLAPQIRDFLRAKLR